MHTVSAHTVTVNVIAHHFVRGYSITVHTTVSHIRACEILIAVRLIVRSLKLCGLYGCGQDARFLRGVVIVVIVILFVLFFVPRHALIAVWRLRSVLLPRRLLRSVAVIVVYGAMSIMSMSEGSAILITVSHVAIRHLPARAPYFRELTAVVITIPIILLHLRRPE